MENNTNGKSGHRSNHGKIGWLKIFHQENTPYSWKNNVQANTAARSRIIELGGDK